MQVHFLDPLLINGNHMDYHVKKKQCKRIW